MFGAPLVEDPRLFDLLGKADFCTAPGKIKIISKFCVFVTQMMRSNIESDPSVFGPRTTTIRSCMYHPKGNAIARMTPAFREFSILFEGHL